MNRQMYSILVLFLFLHFVKSSCDSDDIQKITECYHQHIFQALQITAYNFATEKYANLAFSSQENLRRACSAKDKLDQCLDASTIQRCLNTANFLKVPFANTEDTARKFIANYLQFDYACGDGNRIAKKACSYSTNLCPNYDPTSCTSFQAHAKCLGKAATNSCGRTYGCYIEKLNTLNICYTQKNCGVCNSLSVSRNPIYGICSADVNFAQRQSLNLFFFGVSFFSAFLMYLSY